MECSHRETNRFLPLKLNHIKRVFFLFLVVLGIIISFTNSTFANEKTDKAIIEARKAFSNKDLTHLEKVLPTAVQDPLIGRYPRSWNFRLLLKKSSENPLLESERSRIPLLYREIESFIEENPRDLASDMLRQDVLLDQAQKNTFFPGFTEKLYNEWMLRDNSEVHCYFHQTHASLANNADLTILPQKKYGPACIELLSTWFMQNKVSISVIREKFFQAVESGDLADTVAIAEILSLPQGALNTAIEDPLLLINSHPNAPKEIVLLAFSQLAQKSPKNFFFGLDSAQETEILGFDNDFISSFPSLANDEKAFIFAQIAASNMRSVSADAVKWSELAIKFLKKSSEPTKHPNSIIPSQKNKLLETESAKNNQLANPIVKIGDKALNSLARSALIGPDWDLLEKVITHMSDQEQRTPTWIYWLGRIKALQGKGDEAKTLWQSLAGQFHFYSQLAEIELTGSTFPLPENIEIFPATYDDTQRKIGFIKAQKFYNLGLRAEGNLEWNFQLRGMDDRSLVAAAYWACQQALYDRCINTSERTSQDHNFSLRFIKPFFKQVELVAQKYQIDPAWIYGLIRQESRFIINAHSSASAHGLMQIIPKTARWIAKKLGDTSFKLTDLGNHQKNLEYGIFYLKHVLDKSEQNIGLAAAAYNAGPHRVEFWRTQIKNSIEGAAFAESIPFSETRDYVKKVLSNIVFYSQIESKQPYPLKKLLGTIAPLP